MSLLRIVWVAGATFALSACGGGSNFSDIDQYMAEVESREARPIEPLPPFEQVEPYAYQASAQRQPFDPPVLVRKLERRADGVKVKPNFDRVRQYLEQFPIGQLALVGLASDGSIGLATGKSEKTKRRA